MDRLYDIMCLENSVHDGDFLSRDLADGDVANLVAGIRWIDEEKAPLRNASSMGLLADFEEQRHSARAWGGGSVH
jgi:hypothetical protein